MDLVQTAADNFASSIVSRVQTTDMLIDTAKHDSLVQKQQLLDTLQLIYSDLLAEVLQSPTHKLFYLKSKIEQLDNGQSLSIDQHDYLAILKSELKKLNQDNKLLG